MDQITLAKERDAKGVCIICEDATTRITRGLCVKHYTRWQAARSPMTEEQRLAYDAKLVKLGLLMPSRRGGRPVTDDVFADAAAEFLDLEAADRTSVDAEQLAEQYVEEAAAEPTAKKPPKKGRAGGTRKKS